MNFVYTRKALTFILFLSCSLYALAQEQPYSISEDKSEILYHVNLDRKQLAFEDSLSLEIGAPARIAEILPIDINLDTLGRWIDLSNTQKVWKLTIKAPDAYGLIVYYKDFYIPRGGELFVYNEDYSKSLASYTSEQNPSNGIYSTSILAGDKITLEYVAPSKQTELPRFHIDGIGYKYKPLNENFYIEDNDKLTKLNETAGLGCMINVNCPEGANWQKEKKGIIRLYTRIGSSIYSCSGSLVNNTNEDGTPLVLSAYHCFEPVGGVLPSYERTEFRFNYEFSGCGNELIGPEEYILTGAEPLVLTPINGGSDGALLKITQTIPAEWNVYYNGWDLRDQDNLFNSGVVIHHPLGDVKKISTYSSPLTTVTANTTSGTGQTGAHWMVQYSSSVTAQGSSGSPLFNSDKLIVGTLTGGNSDCDNLTAPDVYGKMSYHWDKYVDSKLWMKTYLDPENKLTSQGGNKQQLRGIFASDINNKEEKEDKNRFSTYFDANGSVVIQSKKDLMTYVRIYDLLGNFLYSGKIADQLIESIPASVWPSGVYLVKVDFGDNGSESRKILKPKK